MLNKIRFRSATMEDGAMLHRWRNDEATRSASHSTSVVDINDHMAWLAATLKNPSRTLLIAEDLSGPVGTVRADLEAGITELSWTVDPASRGRGIAKAMVKAAVLEFSGPLKAEVKKENVASARVAEFAGMEVEKELDGVIHFFIGEQRDI